MMTAILRLQRVEPDWPCRTEVRQARRHQFVAQAGDWHRPFSSPFRLLSPALTFYEDVLPHWCQFTEISYCYFLWPVYHETRLPEYGRIK